DCIERNERQSGFDRSHGGQCKGQSNHPAATPPTRTTRIRDPGTSGESVASGGARWGETHVLLEELAGVLVDPGLVFVGRHYRFVRALAVALCVLDDDKHAAAWLDRMVRLLRRFVDSPGPTSAG